MSDSTISIERTFNLGDYKSFKVNLSPGDDTEEERTDAIINLIFDANEALYLHQLIAVELDGREGDYWRAKLTALKELKDSYLT